MSTASSPGNISCHQGEPSHQMYFISSSHATVCTRMEKSVCWLDSLCHSFCALNAGCNFCDDVSDLPLGSWCAPQMHFSFRSCATCAVARHACTFERHSCIMHAEDLEDVRGGTLFWIENARTARETSEVSSFTQNYYPGEANPCMGVHMVHTRKGQILPKRRYFQLVSSGKPLWCDFKTTLTVTQQKTKMSRS